HTNQILRPAFVMAITFTEAGYHGPDHEAAVGSLPASEYPTSEATFASRLAPTVCPTKPLWEACLQANTPHQRPHSPAGWLPQFALQSRCGSLPASEYPTSEAAFASRLAPTVCPTKPLWEACLQANTPIRGRIRQQAG